MVPRPGGELSHDRNRKVVSLIRAAWRRVKSIMTEVKGQNRVKSVSFTGCTRQLVCCDSYNHSARVNSGR